MVVTVALAVVCCTVFVVPLMSAMGPCVRRALGSAMPYENPG